MHVPAHAPGHDGSSATCLGGHPPVRPVIAVWARVEPGTALEADGSSGRRSARWSARSLAVSTTSRSRTPVAMDPGGTPKRPRLRQDAEDTVQNRSSSHSVESSRAAPDHERLHAPMLARGDPLRAVTPWRALPDFAGRARRRNRGSPSRWSTPRLCGKSRSGYSESRSLFNKPL